MKSFKKELQEKYDAVFLLKSGAARKSAQKDFIGYVKKNSNKLPAEIASEIKSKPGFSAVTVILYAADLLALQPGRKSSGGHTCSCGNKMCDGGSICECPPMETGGKVKEDKFWISGSIKNGGILRKKATQMGLIKGDDTLSEADLVKLEALGGKWVKRVQLARNLKNMEDGGFVSKLEILPSETNDAERNPFKIPVYIKPGTDYTFVFKKDIEPIWITQNKQRSELNEQVQAKKNELEKLNNKKHTNNTKLWIERNNKRNELERELNQLQEKAYGMRIHVGSVTPTGTQVVYNEDGTYSQIPEYQEELVRKYFHDIYKMETGGEIKEPQESPVINMENNDSEEGSSPIINYYYNELNRLKRAIGYSKLSIEQAKYRGTQKDMAAVMEYQRIIDKDEARMKEINDTIADLENKMKAGGVVNQNSGITNIIISPAAPLSSTLYALTGKSWNAIDFDIPNQTDAPFTEKSTGRKFLAINGKKAIDKGISGIQLPSEDVINEFYESIENKGELNTVSKYRDSGLLTPDSISSILQGYATGAMPKEKYDLMKKLISGPKKEEQDMWDGGLPVTIKNLGAEGKVFFSNEQGYYVKFPDGSDGYFQEDDLIWPHIKSMAEGGTITGDKIAKVMHEFKEGTLKSSSGDLVTDRKQAIAIALSEAGVSKKEEGGTVYPALRGVKVTYDDGTVISTSMASHLTDDEIRDYFRVGKSFNIGSGVDDKMAKVQSVEILEDEPALFLTGGQIPQYFKGLDISVLPDAVKEYIEKEILTDEYLNNLDDANPDFIEIRTLIESKYPAKSIIELEPVKEATESLNQEDINRAWLEQIHLSKLMLADKSLSKKEKKEWIELKNLSEMMLQA